MVQFIHSFYLFLLFIHYTFSQQEQRPLFILRLHFIFLIAFLLSSFSFRGKHTIVYDMCLFFKFIGVKNKCLSPAASVLKTGIANKQYHESSWHEVVALCNPAHLSTIVFPLTMINKHFYHHFKFPTEELIHLFIYLILRGQRISDAILYYDLLLAT